MLILLLLEHEDKTREGPLLSRFQVGQTSSGFHDKHDDDLAATVHDGFADHHYVAATTFVDGSEGGALGLTRPGAPLSLFLSGLKGKGSRWEYAAGERLWVSLHGPR
jgi:hypothetical protein